ncbi:glycosyltransferase family 4 protein [Methanofollis ethanolicus]|uniref:glycosyltransferase family 4 protein n=1 Tax=Methanofollis ethanolicus TaxID=488124 RepID=UPI000833C49E|nr:glycosyltransferase family 4 protein [Methanofollis ethanolicus]
MRVAYFLDEFPPFLRGGLGTYALEMAPRLAAAGHDLTVYAFRMGDAAVEEEWAGARVRRLPLPEPAPLLPVVLPSEVAAWPPDAAHFFADYLFYNIVSAGDLLARGEGTDLAVAHDWLAAPAAMVTAASLGIPFVFHVHSTEGGRSEGGGSPTVRALEARALEKAAAVITVSHAMEDELLALGVPAEKIRVVHNGVDTAKYDPARIPPPEVRAFRDRLGIGCDPLVLFIGRLTRVKGVDILLRAFGMLLQEVPAAHLLVLGVGEMDGEIRRLADEVGEGRVHLEFSFLPEKERILRYAAADVCVFPSTYEPFGIVCTEAMAMGKPVVVGARGTSGMREQVVPAGEGICGFHINPHDPADIATYLSLVLRDPALRDQMGRNGRARAVSLFSWNRAARETAAVYEEAVRGGKRS